jgi:DNA-binding NtrC family response regulator
LSLQLTPLREREEDIGILFKHFVQHYCNRHDLRVPFITEEAVGELIRFSWPGNIRELRNAAERLAILHTSDVVTMKEIELLDIGSTSLRLDQQTKEKPLRVKRSLSDEDLYQQYLQSGMNKEAFARYVGISRTTLWRKFGQFEH